MPECVCLESCPYFESGVMKELDLSAKLRQEEFCLGDYSKCARYMVFEALGQENVPKDLLPFQVERAKEIIDKSKK